MPHLENLSIGHRIALTVVIVIAVILLLALVGYLSGRWEQAQAEEAPAYVAPIEYEPHMLELERKALDEAFIKHFVRLYDIWVTDYQPTEPPRAVRGANNARHAYLRYIQRLDKRLDDLRKRQEAPQPR
jgi:hypothetical protein